jgi:AcrR family transcriptional regulator
LGTVYRRFSSKEDILVAALQLYIEMFRAQVTADAFPGPTAAARIDVYFLILTRILVSRPHLARALIRALASGVPDVTSRVAQFRDQMTSLVELAMVGPDGAACEVPVARRRDVAFLLQNLWFAEIVGWAGGISTEEVVLANTRTAAGLLLAGAVAAG